MQGLEGRGRKHNAQDVIAEEKAPHDPPKLQIFKAVSGDEGESRGSQPEPVFMFLDSIH